MNGQVSIPVWLLLILVFLSVWVIGQKILLPSVRALIRRREKKAIDDINRRLDLQLPEFKLFKRRTLIQRLLYDDLLREEIHSFCQETGMSPEEALKKAERYAQEIVPSFNAYIYFKMGNLLSKSIIRALYRVRVGFTDEEGLAQIDPFSSLVFVMNHRSNMDYVLLGCLSFQRVALSFAVGEWARVWPLKPLISAMGAFFVRRGSQNSLYRIVLARYVQLATQGGVIQAVYPEGRLSRDGKAAKPKLGILDYMLRRYDAEKERDIVFIPVGINYDRILEDRSLLSERNFDEKKKSLLGIVWTTTRYIGRSLWLLLKGEWFRFGYAVVNFGTPISMKEHIRQHGVDYKSLEREERIERVRLLAGKLMRAVSAVIPVVPVPLIASVFAENPEKKFSKQEISAAVQKLSRRLEKRGAYIHIPRSDWAYTRRVGLRTLILRHLVSEEDRLYRAVPEEMKTLRFYANSIQHFLDP